ncbi:MAG: oligosaccharide flippase family protein [Pirellulales bacterium]
MSKPKSILWNIMSNLSGFSVHAVVIFFLTPFVLHQLGDIRYGLWILTLSVTGHYGLLSLGLRGGINQYLTRYLANRDYTRMNGVASTAFIVLFVVGVVVVVVSILVALSLPYWVEIPAGLTDDIVWSLLIIGISSGIQMPLHVFSAIFPAAQRFDVTNAVEIITRLLSAGLIYFFVSSGYGLVGLSLATVSADFFGHFLRWRLAHKIIPDLKLSTNSYSQSQLKEMMSYGIWSFVIAVAASLFIGADALVIGAIMPVTAVAFYSLGAGLVRQLEGALRPIDQVFCPVATALDAEKDAISIRSMYLKASRLTMLALSVASVPAGLWANDFYRLWVGERYLLGDEFASVAVVFHILLAAMVARLIPAVGVQILLAIRRVKLLAIISIVEAGVNVAISIVLAYRYGLVGVALGTLISALLFRTVVVPWLVGRELKVPTRTFFIEAMLRPLLVSILLTLILVLFKSNIPPATSLSNLALSGLVAGISGLGLAFTIGLRREERQQYCYEPLLRARTKFKF